MLLRTPDHLQEENNRIVYRALNELFAQGNSVLDPSIGEVLQGNVPQPILVTLEGVLASFDGSLSAVNPQASNAISILRDYGNVVIVSHNPDWRNVHTFLQDQRLWSDDMLQLSLGNWEGVGNAGTSTDTSHLQNTLLISYSKYLQELREQYPYLPISSFENLSILQNVRSKKLFGPVFRKVRIPLIDTSLLEATYENPGIYPLPVVRFDNMQFADLNDPRYLSLGDAVKAVINRYTNPKFLLSKNGDEWDEEKGDNG